MASRRDLLRAGLMVAAAIGYAALAVATAPWTLYSGVFTALPGLVALGYAVRRGWHRPGARVRQVRVEAVGALGLMIWTLLLTVLAAWVLAIFYSDPRSVYPTLSHLMNTAFDNYGLRIAGFSAWLGLGWYLMRR